MSIITKLPIQAQIYVDGIQADLQRTKDLVTENVSDQTSFTLHQTEERYLPDILHAYTVIPEESRNTLAINDAGKTADEILVSQLKTLAWATREATEALIKEKSRDLVVNERFITQKFPDQHTEETYSVVKIEQPKKPIIVYQQKISFSRMNPVENLLTSNTEVILPISISCLFVFAAVAYFFLSYLPDVDKKDVQNEITTMANYSAKIGPIINQIKDGEVLRSDQENITKNGITGENLEDPDKPGQYFIKKSGKKIIIIDQQEHSAAGIKGIDKESGGKCNNDCWHLEMKDGHPYGRT